jgi:metal-sulfur cluster biosynthetic enzyme
VSAGGLARRSEPARTAGQDPICREHAAAEAAAAGALTPAREVEARLWVALRDVEDPEIPISVVGMGLIVSIAYREDERAVDLELTFTAMGCPAMDFIEDDIRERLLREPDVDEVRVEIVWDPIWTRSRIRDEARATMRGLGIVA